MIFLNIVTLWNPWLVFFSEIVILQFIILYFIFIICNSNNLFFTLFYIFLIFIYFGLFLALLNLDIFTAFLWLTECVIVFISIIMLFYLNVHGPINYINYINYSFKYFNVVFLILLVNLNKFYYFESEFFLPVELNSYVFLENYYESLYNYKLNDFYGLFNSFYVINSLEFLITGFLLLLGSLVCVNLNKLNKLNKSFNYNSLFSIFDFFYDFVKFFFLRKQNLINQNNQISSLKILKKKIKK